MTCTHPAPYPGLCGLRVDEPVLLARAAFTRPQHPLTYEQNSYEVGQGWVDAAIRQMVTLSV